MARRPPGRRDGRGAAAAILESIDRGRGHSNALLAALPPGLDARDRSLATELVYGVLRRRMALDGLIEGVSSRPLREIDAALLTILRLAAYQILFLTRVPRPAAVDEAVKRARSRCGPASAAFANAVLRAACRALDERAPADPPRPGPGSAPGAVAAYLERTRSFPRFLVDRFLLRYGPEECEALLDAMNRPAPVVLRPTRSGGDAATLARGLASEGIATAPSPVLAGALRVVDGVPQRSPLFRQGAFYIQDEASQIVAGLLLPLAAGGGLLDLCAAPGGKILAATEVRAPDDGPVVAADISLARLAILDANARRLGAGPMLRVVMDAARPALRRRFGRVLLDAPCSGTGIIRRHPEIRWRRGPGDIERFADLQARALEGACEVLAPNGRLVYAVCSLEPEEGPERITALLRDRRDLAIEDARELVPSEARALVDSEGFLRTLPHRHDIDGFFAAVLSKRTED